MSSRGPAAVQRINFSLAENMIFTNNTLHANFTGTTNVSVLLFDAAGDYEGPTAFLSDSNVVGPAANDGSIYSVFEPGVYEVELTIAQANAADVSTAVFGLSLNVDALGLTNTPSLAIPGMSHVVPVTALQNQQSAQVITANYRITQTFARAVGGALIRAHGSGGDDNAPANLIAAAFAIRITKTSDIAF